MLALALSHTQIKSKHSYLNNCQRFPTTFTLQLILCIACPHKERSPDPDPVIRYNIALTAAHNFHNIDDPLHVLARRQQTLQQQVLKLCPQFGRGPAHNIHKLGRQLERGLLEAQILWRDVQNETKVDMDQVAVRVQQNVSVVPGNAKIIELIPSFAQLPVNSSLPVLHLQQIRDQTIRRTTLHELALRLLEVVPIHIAVLIDKVLLQAFIRVFLNLVYADRIQDRLNQPRVIGQADDLVGSHPQTHTLLLPDQTEHL